MTSPSPSLVEPPKGLNRFELVHHYGLKRHPLSWWVANSVAAQRAKSHGLDVVKHKEAISGIVLAVLDAAGAA